MGEKKFVRGSGERVAEGINESRRCKQQQVAVEMEKLRECGWEQLSILERAVRKDQIT